MVRDRFATPEIKVDSIHDLGRIIKVVGTVGRKGGDTAERPHRVSYPVGDHLRRPCAALRTLLLMPQPPTPPSTPSTTRRRRLPLAAAAPAALPRMTTATTTPLTSVAPVNLCSPMQQLWDVGFPADRSRALFGVTRLLVHKGLAPEEIVEVVTDFDRRTGAKLVGRDAAAYVRRDYEKIIDSAEPGVDINPPCRMVQEMGYCPVNTDPRAVCELHDPVIDVAAAIEALPVGLPTGERGYRLRRVFDALALGDASDIARHLARLGERFGLTEGELKGALIAAATRASQSSQEQPLPTKQSAGTAMAMGSPALSARDGAPVLPPVALLDGAIDEDGNTYCVPTRDGRRVISSFVLKPTRRIIMERGEIIVADGHTDIGTSFPNIFLPREAFGSRRDLLRYLPSPDMQWTGDDKNVQGVLRRLAGQRDVPRQQGTSVLGAYTHEGVPLWIFPGGAISAAGPIDPPPVVYVPSGNSLDARVRYEPTDDATFAAIARVVFTDLPRVNLPDVVVPLIGWFLATPLKPR
ncbi:MAG: hypothetical protein IPN17_32890 [Deltaproteobacteria bacterium]|nr:hypothetical protein [Deltaproteobacteria bacterium]